MQVRRPLFSPGVGYKVVHTGSRTGVKRTLIEPGAGLEQRANSTGARGKPEGRYPILARVSRRVLGAGGEMDLGPPHPS